MKQILKICGKFLILTSFMFGVEVSVSGTNIVLGESLTYTISSNNTNTKFPKIAQIEGQRVFSSGISTQVSSINGVTKTNISKNYILTPTKSFTIPSFDIEVNSKIFKTKSIPIVVSKATQSKNKDYSITMSVDKNVSFMNEKINLDIEIKLNQNVQLDKIEFVKSDLNDFWVSEPIKSKREENNFLFHNIRYEIYPKKTGKININSSSLKLGIIDGNRFSMFSNPIKWRTIYSNDIELNVKPLPDGVYLYGDFDIKLKVDKLELNANEPLNVSLEVSGNGNIKDLLDFEIDIPKATIHSDKSNINNGVFVQKFAILSDQNFTLPSISIQYFDGNKTVVKKTKPINIVVKNSVLPSQKEKIVIKTEIKEKIIYKNSYTYMLFSFIFGFTLAIVSFLFFTKQKKVKEKKLYKKISFMSDKELLKNLLLYPKVFDEVIKQLESNIYSDTKYKIDRKKIKREAKRLNI